MALPHLDQIPQHQQAAFERVVRQVCIRLKVQPGWLMVVMYRESQLKPTALNRQSGATGLIQFTPVTARNLGTSTEALASLSATAQMPFVERYYHDQINPASPPKSVYDLYLLTLYPAAMGKPDSHVVFSPGSKAYQQNSSLDKARKGYVTVADVKAFVDGAIPSGWAMAATSGLAVGGLLFAGFLVYLTNKYLLV